MTNCTVQGNNGPAVSGGFSLVSTMSNDAEEVKREFALVLERLRAAEDQRNRQDQGADAEGGWLDEGVRAAAVSRRSFLCVLSDSLRFSGGVPCSVGR